MATNLASEEITEELLLGIEHFSMWGMFWRRFRRHRLALVGMIILVLLALMAIAAPLIAPTTYTHLDFTAILQPPSIHHLMGTDQLGHDVFTQFLYGARYSLFIGLVSTIVLVLIGTIVGSLAGYYGGMVDNLLMRFVDIMLTFPILLLQIAVASELRGGSSITLIIGIIALFSWMGTARLVRGEFLRFRNMEFAEAAKSAGASDARVIFRHILPNAIGPVLVSATLAIGGAIIVESSLSFLGLGVQPPIPTWGNMIGTNQAAAMVAPWLVAFPGFGIVLTVLAINFIGDGIRDALDPTAMAKK